MNNEVMKFAGREEEQKRLKYTLNGVSWLFAVIYDWRRLEKSKFALIL